VGIFSALKENVNAIRWHWTSFDAGHASGIKFEAMAVLDILDAINVFGYFASFWLFIFKNEFRRSCSGAWSRAGAGRRCLLGVEALVSFLCGLGPFAFAWWFLIP